MAFLPNRLPSLPNDNAVIDYRLQRRQLLRQYEDGLVGRDEICDAHNELRRAGEHAQSTQHLLCPICDRDDARRVTYVFGPRLPSGGRCLITPGDEARLRRRKGVFTAYAVEVCISCGWNHLLEAFKIRGKP